MSFYESNRMFVCLPVPKIKGHSTVFINFWTYDFTLLGQVNNVQLFPEAELLV